MKQKIQNEQRAFRFKRFARKSYSAFNSMHKVVSIGVVTGCILTFAHANDVIAQTSVDAHHPLTEEKELEEVVVTASRTEMPIELVARTVTVITRSEIAQAPAQSVQDLLKHISGIDVRQRGPNGVQSDISLRGGTSDQTAILLNGINLTNPQTGHYSFDIPINLSDIERIEIIQGPASLVYGASAFSGGINIITRKHPDEIIHADIQGGMHQLGGAEAGGALLFQSSTHQLSAGYHSSGGYMENSDSKIFSSLWQSRFLTEESAIDFQVGFNDKKYGATTFYSGAYPDQYDNTQSLFAAIKGKTNGKIKFIPQLYWNRHWDCFKLFRDGTPDIPSWYTGANNHRSDVFGFNLNAQYTWKGGISNLGGEFRNEGIFSNVLGKPMEKPYGEYTHSDNRSNISYFLDHSFLWKKITAGLGVLAYYQTSVRENFNFFPNFNIAYQASGSLKFHASWNTAMRMPTFTDLYYKDKAQIGNPALLPEKSSAYEIGANYRNRFLRISLAGFYLQGRDVIDWVKKPEDPLYQAQNLSKLDKKGIESQITMDWGAVLPVMHKTRLNFSYTYINQSQDVKNLESNYALDYLKHKFTAQLTHPLFKNVTVDWQFRWQDRMGKYTRYVNLQKESEVAYLPYSILDLKIDWQLKDFISIYVSASNLFDVAYHDLGNVPQPGFWALGGVRIVWRGPNS